MTTPDALGYAFALSLPPADDRRLRLWAEATPGATFDAAGGHVTLARFTGSVPPGALLPALREACESVPPVAGRFNLPSREPYWDKAGTEIVMLVGERPEDVGGVLDLRERLLAAVLPLGVSLAEGGPYRPHVTLTTGLAPQEALRLEAAAGSLDLRFTSHEVVYWCGGETLDPEAVPEPPWQVVERVLLQPPEKR
jgi:hypothetical protein